MTDPAERVAQTLSGRVPVLMTFPTEDGGGNPLWGTVVHVWECPVCGVRQDAYRRSLPDVKCQSCSRRFTPYGPLETVS